MDWPEIQIRAFRALLYCYPAEFRHEYGTPMEQLFRDRMASDSGLRVWAEAVADLAMTAPGEHWQILASDVRYGTRILVAHPAFSLVALMVMALGIGATVSVFSVVNAVLLRSLPYGHPEKLVYLWSPNSNLKGVPDELGPNVPDFYEWQRLGRGLANSALFQQAPVSVVRNGSAERVGAAFVTGSFFDTMQAWPRMGRKIDAGDDRPGHEAVAVISNAFWKSEFASAGDVIGRQLQLNRKSYRVVGVMPEGFGYPFDGDVPYDSSGFKQTDIWVPAAYTAQQRSDRENFASAVAIGRLRDGTSAQAAQAELAAIEGHLQPLYAPMWRGWTVLVRPLVGTIVGPVEKMLWLLMGAVGLVLLIAISNVANLLLARATARAHEMGIRTALGAERARIVRQLLTEALLLSVTGGGFGVALAFGAVRVLTLLNPGGIPRFESTAVDGRVLMAAVLLSVAAGVLAGIAPALSASKANVNELLRRAGTRIAGGSNRLRFALIVSEVALSVVLLAASGLLIRSYVRLAAVDPGFSQNALTFRVDLDERYSTPQAGAALYTKLLEKLKNIPGVRFAGATSSIPLSHHESVTGAEILGYGSAKEMVESWAVTPDYRRAIGMPLLRGRDFDVHDAGSKTPVAMVNQQFAATYFPGRDPVGGRIRTGMGDLSKTGWMTVIGVLANDRHKSLEEASLPLIVQPADSGGSFVVASTRPTEQVVDEARGALRTLDPVLTLENVRTMSQRVKENTARRSFETLLLTGFAGLAVALALTGLYGLISYTVKQRTAEIGVRLAIGSSRTRILVLMLSQGMRVTLLGLAIGMAGAFGMTRLLRAWLFDVTSTDPATFLVVPLLILSVGFCACLIPAWAATRIDPIQALRQD